MRAVFSVDGVRLHERHGMKHLVKELEGSMEMDLDPARGLLDALSGVIRAPPFDEAHTQDAQPTQVVYANTRCC